MSGQVGNQNVGFLLTRLIKVIHLLPLHLISVFFLHNIFAHATKRSSYYAAYMVHVVTKTRFLTWTRFLVANKSCLIFLGRSRTVRPIPCLRWVRAGSGPFSILCSSAASGCTCSGGRPLTPGGPVSITCSIKNVG